MTVPLAVVLCALVASSDAVRDSTSDVHGDRGSEPGGGLEGFAKAVEATEACCVNHEKEPLKCYTEGAGSPDTQAQLLKLPMQEAEPFNDALDRVRSKCAAVERQRAAAMLHQQGTSSDAGAVRQQDIETFTAILRATETCCVSSEKDPWACYNEGIGSPDTQAQLLKLPMEEVSPLLAEQNRVFSKCASLEKDPMEEYRKLLRTTRDCCVNREKAPYTCYQEGIGSSETQAQLLKLPLDDVSPFLAEVNHVFLKCSALEKQ
mmetsp:Transcript_81081/g.229698  ORF Transcript_81081/g.229698 Transcript_81081/m.229698 type:complete len:262 (+) Transcript_81081:116-901(+)